MPIRDQNSVTPGTICYTCAHFLAKDCPYENYNKKSALEFKAEMNGSCPYFQVVDVEMVYSAEPSSGMKKAAELNDPELNVSIYRMVRALKSKDQNELFNYWSSLFPQEYAKQMVTDKTETKQRNPNKVETKKTKKNKFTDNFKVKVKKDL